MMGLPICSRVMPLACQSALAPAIRRPCVLVALRSIPLSAVELFSLFISFLLLIFFLFYIFISYHCSLIAKTLTADPTNFSHQKAYCLLLTAYCLLLHSQTAAFTNLSPQKAYCLLLIAYCFLLFAFYILHNPFPHLTRAAGITAVGNIFGHDSLLQAGIHRLTNQRTLLHQPETIFEHEGCREDHRYRVGDILAGSLRIRAMDRLEQRGVQTYRC